MYCRSRALPSGGCGRSPARTKSSWKSSGYCAPARLSDESIESDGAMGASEGLAMKVPTADLETRTPQKPDEDSYEDIDDSLEGKPVSGEVLTTFRGFYMATRHKRALPVAIPLSN
jgi:NH3-dependent NAD+ synthetase